LSDLDPRPALSWDGLLDETLGDAAELAFAALGRERPNRCVVAMSGSDE
jgi:hypothetical protein